MRLFGWPEFIAVDVVCCSSSPLARSLSNLTIVLRWHKPKQTDYCDSVGCKRALSAPFCTAQQVALPLNESTGRNNVALHARQTEARVLIHSHLMNIQANLFTMLEQMRRPTHELTHETDARRPRPIPMLLLSSLFVAAFGIR